MCLGTAPGSFAQNGLLCRLERGHMGIEASVGSQHSRPTGTSSPSKSILVVCESSPSQASFSCPGPGAPSSLPCSQRVPVNPGGHTHSPSWSWQTPPCRQPGHSLVQSCPQRPASQPAGMYSQQLTLTHWTTASEDWGAPGGSGGSTGSMHRGPNLPYHPPPLPSAPDPAR